MRLTDSQPSKTDGLGDYFQLTKCKPFLLSVHQIKYVTVISISSQTALGNHIVCMLYTGTAVSIDFASVTLPALFRSLAFHPLSLLCIFSIKKSKA